MQNNVRLSTIQKEIHSWSVKNFGHKVEMYFDVSSFLGIVEEIGELAHCMLKVSQGIRGSKQEHIEKAKDAIGDALIYFLDFVERNNDQFEGVDVDAMLDEVWARVKKRDWSKNKIDGGDASDVMGPAPFKELPLYSIKASSGFMEKSPSGTVRAEPRSDGGWNYYGAEDKLICWEEKNGNRHFPNLDLPEPTIEPPAKEHIEEAHRYVRGSFPD